MGFLLSKCVCTDESTHNAVCFLSDPFAKLCSRFRVRVHFQTAFD